MAGTSRSTVLYSRELGRGKDMLLMILLQNCSKLVSRRLQLFCGAQASQSRRLRLNPHPRFRVIHANTQAIVAAPRAAVRPRPLQHLQMPFVSTCTSQSKVNARVHGRAVFKFQHASTNWDHSRRDYFDDISPITGRLQQHDAGEALFSIL